MKITINASIKDAIDRVQLFIEYIKKIPSQKKVLEYDLAETTAADIKSLLLGNDIDNCYFSDNCLFITTSLSTEEISKKIIDRQQMIDYWVWRLVKWSNDKEEFKTQINQYLDKYSYKYVEVINAMQEYKQKEQQ